MCLILKGLPPFDRLRVTTSRPSQDFFSNLLEVVEDLRERMFMKIFVTVFFLIALVFPLPPGFADSTDASAVSSGNGHFLAQGESLFLHYCSHCHGLKGEGDGYNAEFLEKEPADLSDPEFMNKKKDGQIFRVIQKGGVGVHKSYLMPVFGHTLSEEEIWSLVSYVRTLSGNAADSVSIPKTVSRDKPKMFKPTHKDIFNFSAWFSRGQEQGLIDDGEKLFRKKKSCLACHQVGEDGGHVGPNLTRAGFLYPPEWLYVWLENPQNEKPKTKMPNLGLNDSEVKAVIAFLTSLKGGVGEFPEEWLTYLAVKGDAENGKRLFYDPKSNANCVKCHSINKKGGVVGPDLGFVGSARTLPFLLESILDPNKVITVGFAKVTLLFKEKYQGKRTLTGSLVNEDESSLDLMDKDGKAHHFAKDRIMKVLPRPSEMAQGRFKKKLSVEEIRDILAFLETLEWPAMAGIDLAAH